MRLIPADVRNATRTLWRNPLFALVATLSLGLALALNTTMFGIVDAIMHPPMPYPAPERLFTVRIRGDDPRKVVRGEDKARAVREGLTLAEGVATSAWQPATVIAANDGSDGLVSLVSPEFFRVVGVAPVAGRVLGPGAAERHEAVIDFALWRRAFAERPVSEGLTIEVNEQPFTVVGVMPPGVKVGGGFVWIPAGSLTADSASAAFRSVAVQMIVRLKAGASKASLERDLAVVSRRLQTELGSPNYPLGATVIGTDVERPRLNSFHKFLMIVVAGVLAIACANLATLLLARGAVRRREMAVRLAIGASRWTVARHVLLECALIAAGGAGVGLVLSHWAMRLVAHWAPPYVPQLGEFVPAPSWRVFAFALVVAVVVMLVAGLLPAVRAASVPPAEPLKDGAGTTRRRRDRYSVLVVAEVAMSTALLMLAALLTLGNWKLARHEFGFNARRVLVATAQVLPKREKTMTGADRVRLREEILTRLRALPDVRDAATVRAASPRGPVVIGENGASGERWINLRTYDVVSPSYLRTMGIPVVDGRDFSDGDAAGSVPVAIVDRAAARRLWPEFASPVGRMLKLGAADSDAPWVRVIGVTQPLGRRPEEPTYLEDEPDIRVVRPGDPAMGAFVVAAASHDAALPVAVRRELKRVAGNDAWTTVEPYTAGFDQNLRFVGFLSMLLLALSAFALVLCAVGLYGVLAVTVTYRMREFAIRIALGARSSVVARLVMRDAVVMGLAGVGIGAFIALGATAGMAADMLDIRFAHAKALVAAEIVLLLVAVGAAWDPVRRGMRADPASMLQSN